MERLRLYQVRLTKEMSGRSRSRDRSAQAQVQVRGYKAEKLEPAVRTLCFICPSYRSVPIDNTRNGSIYLGTVSSHFFFSIRCFRINFYLSVTFVHRFRFLVPRTEFNKVVGLFFYGAAHNSQVSHDLSSRVISNFHTPFLCEYCLVSSFNPSSFPMKNFAKLRFFLFLMKTSSETSITARCYHTVVSCRRESRSRYTRRQ